MISQLTKRQRTKKPFALQIVARAYPALDSTTLAFLEIFKPFEVLNRGGPREGCAFNGPRSDFPGRQVSPRDGPQDRLPTNGLHNPKTSANQ